MSEAVLEILVLGVVYFLGALGHANDGMSGYYSWVTARDRFDKATSWLTAVRFYCMLGIAAPALAESGYVWAHGPARRHGDHLCAADARHFDVSR